MVIEYMIAGAIGLGVLYIMSQQQPAVAARAPASVSPATSPTTTVVTEVVPTPTPTPTTEEGPTMQESMNIARTVVEGSPPYPSDDCHTLVNTGAGSLRTPYGYWFTFTYTCNKMGMMPMVAEYSASVTVINGVVSSVDIIRTHP